MVERACADDGLSSKISGLSGLLSISSILSLVLLVFPRPSKGSVWESTQTHVGAGTRALLGPRASASRRRALRGAAQGGADVVSRFPLLAPEARCGALRTLGAVAWALSKGVPYQKKSLNLWMSPLSPMHIRALTQVLRLPHTHLFLFIDKLS